MRTLKQLMDLTGRVALVTGADGHIGHALCEGLLEQGAKVLFLDKEESQEGVELRKKAPAQTAFFKVDLEQEATYAHIDVDIERDFGRLDILVHCAAFVGTNQLVGWNAPFMEQSVETWRRAVEVNMTAPFLLTQRVSPLLQQSGHASVIFISSIYGVCGPDLGLYEGTDMNNPAAYAASKGGLLQLTRWMSTVLAPAVRVNAITPGGVSRGQPTVFRDRYDRRTPLGRMAVEEDFKGAVAYLASDLSAYVTGQNLMVDGGWSAW